MATGNGKYRRRGGGTALYITLTVGFLIFAAVIAMSVFFKISKITVTGVSMYSEDDVISASGLELGGSIFFIREGSAVVRIKNALSYVDDVRIIRSLPGTVTIEIVESYPLASVTVGGSTYIIDKNAKVLEETTASGAEGTIEIRGIEPIMPSVGGTLALGSSENVRFRYMRDMLSGILSAGLQDSVTWLDMSNISTIRFDYKGYEINVGQGENIANKLSVLKSFLREHGEDDTGSVDLSIDGEARYIPAR